MLALFHDTMYPAQYSDSGIGSHVMFSVPTFPPPPPRFSGKVTGGAGLVVMKPAK